MRGSFGLISRMGSNLITQDCFSLSQVSHILLYLLELLIFNHCSDLINFDTEGKGPDRKKYEEQIKRLKLRRVAFRTMWLASEDYPLLLGMPASCQKNFILWRIC